MFGRKKERAHAQTGRVAGKGRTGLLAEQGAHVGPVPGLWDHDLSQRQTLNDLVTQFPLLFFLMVNFDE